MFDEYETTGCLLLPNALTEKHLQDVENLLLKEISKHCPDVSTLQDQKWVNLAIEHPEIVTKIYDAVRDAPEALGLGRLPELTKAVNIMMDVPMLYNKVPLRIDVPFQNKELAFWHQDDFYVQGNAREVTIWIPLQDTKAHHGALSVMKGTHQNGAIPHTLEVGKKTLPQGIFDHPINIIEMNRGDALLFSSYLVHSSNLNISDSIRYSIQLRYSDASAGPHSTRMKGVTRV